MQKRKREGEERNEKEEIGVAPAGTYLDVEDRDFG
jgi:hypothetical protein